MTKEHQGREKQMFIEEQISGRALESLMANYKEAQEALMDLVDNAVDNRKEGRPLSVRIYANKRELLIINTGGEGLDLDGLRNYFVWGHSEKTAGQIGFYGVGGKGAAGYLGSGIEVTCSKTGSDEEYRVFDANWETREGGELKSLPVEVRPRSTRTDDGYFRLRITKLKKEVNSTALAAKLADVYRPLLLDGSVSMEVNSKKVEPLEVKLVEDQPELKPRTYSVETRYGQKVIIRIGILAEGQRIKPGVRCYYRGRLIEDEQFFGHPTPAQMSGSSRLMGEAHLDFIRVTPNKTHFDRDSVQWDSASKEINKVLIPWMEKLSRLQIKQASQVEDYEKDLAKEVKRTLDHVLATTGLIGKGDLPGGSFGRRPATPEEEPPKSPKGHHASPKTKEGQTAPVLDATVGQSIRRWGALHGIDVVSMGITNKRGEIVEERGGLRLKINADYPLYQIYKRLGKEDQNVYMAETAVMKVVERIKRENPVEDYLELVDQMMSEYGELLKGRLRFRDRGK